MAAYRMAGLAGALFSLALLTACGTTSGGEAGDDSCSPVYGNWCGKNYPLTGYDPRAVDVWDRACRTHDRCYEDKGFGSKRCDREFVSRLRTLWRGGYPVPHQMGNADSWFVEDGWLNIFVSVRDLGHYWFADCKGGDGEAMMFCYPQVGPPCEIDAAVGRGQPCWCGNPYNRGRTGRSHSR